MAQENTQKVIPDVISLFSFPTISPITTVNSFTVSLEAQNFRVPVITGLIYELWSLHLSFYRAMLRRKQRGYATVCRPSVRLSVRQVP